MLFSFQPRAKHATKCLTLRTRVYEHILRAGCSLAPRVPGKRMEMDSAIFRDFLACLGFTAQANLGFK